MLFSRGKSLTYYIHKMKAFKGITAAAALITCSIGNANPAEAFSSRCKPDGFGVQICITGTGEHHQYNNNPARISNY